MLASVTVARPGPGQYGLVESLRLPQSLNIIVIMDKLKSRGGRRPRSVGINCLVAVEREAWRNELS